MVNLLIGPKGSGKTPDMIHRANDAAKTESGSVIFMKKTHRNTEKIGFNIRTLCMEDFPQVNSIDKLVGFFYGIYSSNSDIKQIFVDETLKLPSVTLETLPTLITFLKDISKEYAIDFYLSISATPQETTHVDKAECNIINY